jgi:hypothetical protein
MIIRLDETRSQQVTNSTINGFYVSVLLLATAVNTLIKRTSYGTGLDFDASQVMVKATLKRDGKVYNLFNNNLGILGQYNSLLSGGKNWLLGTDYIRPAVAAKHKNVRTLFLSLGNHINLKGTDEIDIECTIGRNSFQETTLDTSACYIDIKPAYSIGKQTGIYTIFSETIQAGTTSDTFNLGDNVVKMALMNFEDTDETQQIVSNVSIGSDRFDQSFALPDLITRNLLAYGKQSYNKGYDRASGATTDSYTPAYPQSFILLNDEEIDRATVDLTFDGSKVNSSKNFLVYTSFVTSLELIQNSQYAETKHMEENLSKLPASL